jgi:hypothetical protein
MAASPALAATTPPDRTVVHTWQTNGTVDALGFAAGRVWAGGEFTSVRPPGAAAGTSEQARGHLAVLDSVKGIVQGGKFVHSVNGAVRGIAVSGNDVYVVGHFTTVDGMARGGVAKFNALDGSLVTNWASAAKGSWNAVAVSGDRVYLGGGRLAAVSTTTGGTTSWAPQLGSGVVYALGATVSRVFIGGTFSNINAVQNTGTAALVDTSGTVQPFAAHAALPPKTAQCSSVVKDVDVSGDTAFVANEGTGSGCFDGTWSFSMSSGALRWVNHCLGATQAVLLLNGWVYKGSHAHDCSRDGDPNGFPQSAARHLLAEDPGNGFLAPNYAPPLSGNPLGPRALTSDGVRLWVGGDTQFYAGKTQQGLVAFAP